MGTYTCVVNTSAGVESATFTVEIQSKTSVCLPDVLIVHSNHTLCYSM